MAIKLMYKISDLKEMMGYSQKGMRELLIRLGIPLHLVGKVYYVYLSDLQERFPQLFSSLQLYEALKDPQINE